MNIIVLGAGSFGTAVGNELSVNKLNQVCLFSRNNSKVNEINKYHTNVACFPNKQLNDNLKATSDPKDLINANVIFIAIPSKEVINVLRNFKPYFNDETLFVNLSKGLVSEATTIIESLDSELGIQNTVSLKGPSFAVEVMDHAHTLMTLGYKNSSQYDIIYKIIKDTSIHIDCTNDIRGVEILSVLKNIYALILGVVDAKYNSPNTRFMILTKAFSEVRKLLISLDASQNTLFLSCGFGDLCLTSLNDLSRNRTLGLLIGKGFYNSEYKMNSVILEGLNAIEMVYNYSKKHDLEDLPLLQKIHNFFRLKMDQFIIDFDELLDKKIKTVLTYGTFDLLHYGHLEILKKASLLGDQLIVGLSTDEFNKLKGKTCVLSYAKRKEFLESLDYVTKVIPEDNWEQKITDVKENDVDIFVMGSDWQGKFDEINKYCKVIYFPRTKGISTTKLKSILKDK